MMFTMLNAVIYLCVIMLSCWYEHVACNSNNNTINTKNFHNLRNTITIELQEDEEIGHQLRYDDLDILTYKKSELLLKKIKELYEVADNDPDELISILNNDDPFGVAHITNPSDFVCDKSQRFPYDIDESVIDKFKDHEEGYYIFFQHIRKAGGTTMCALAKENLQRHETSGAYCFLDPWIGSLTSYPYTDPEFFEHQVHNRGLRYVPNEASPFDDDFFNYHGAIFITMFREPMDRWYSQYRFDYLEGRYMTEPERVAYDSPSGHKLTFAEWYRAHKSWFTCPNVYTNAFIGQTLVDKYLVDEIMNRDHTSRPSINYFWGYHQRANIPISYKNFIYAIDNLSRFSMIFILEWLNDEASSQIMFKELLGWTKTVEHVLPQQNVVKRDEDKTQHTLADDVNHDDYMEVARDNVFDLLLYHIAKRIFLERLRCSDTGK